MDEKIKALLVGVNLNDDPDFENALKELESLAEACDMEVVGVETQNVNQINTGVYVGTGKVDEIKAVAHMLSADVVIFDNTLSPMQLRNLKDIIERPILDRTNLILQIFSSRAQTREAKIQVETARLQYELPRLTGMGEVLSRQGGTSGGMSNRGAGEKKLELDKRKIRHRISELKKELKVVEKNRETQRKRRLIQGIPQVALVGYTNAGKSTLMNMLLEKYEQKDEKKCWQKICCLPRWIRRSGASICQIKRNFSSPIPLDLSVSCRTIWYRHFTLRWKRSNMRTFCWRSSIIPTRIIKST